MGNYYGNDAASTYNAFEVKMDKRFSEGLQFLAHYTFSHANNYHDTYYAISHADEWGPVDFNRDHVFVFNPIYELPFGRGKKYKGDASRAMDYVIGGWQISNTTNWSSGLPWTSSIGECGASSIPVRAVRMWAAQNSHLECRAAGSGQPHPDLLYAGSAARVSRSQHAAGGTDACSLSRPVSGPFSLPNCGQIGNMAATLTTVREASIPICRSRSLSQSPNSSRRSSS